MNINNLVLEATLRTFCINDGEYQYRFLEKDNSGVRVLRTPLTVRGLSLETFMFDIRKNDFVDLFAAIDNDSSFKNLNEAMATINETLK